MINNTHAFNRSGSLLSAEPRSQGDPADSGVKAVVINQLVNHPTLVWKSGCWYLKLLEMAIDFLEISIVFPHLHRRLHMRDGSWIRISWSELVHVETVAHNYCMVCSSFELSSRLFTCTRHLSLGQLWAWIYPHDARQKLDCISMWMAINSSTGICIPITTIPIMG